MKKFALGLHHLNIAYVAGDINSYHRQVREAVLPFFSLLTRHSSWRMSLEMTGYTIQFLGENYPQAIEQLRNLVENDQIELISATYAPQLWIAFPRKDFNKSIEINRQILNHYDLPISSIFFAQENFIGEGIKTLSDRFDTAVVKDDYYFYLHHCPDKEELLPPYYQFGEMKLLVGWGHILETMAAQVLKNVERSKSSNSESEILSANPSLRGWFHRVKQRFSNAKTITQHQLAVQESFHRGIHRHGIFLDEPAHQVLLEARQRYLFGSPLTFRVSQYKDMQWTWYHMGSAERYCTPVAFPGDIVRYQRNPDWLHLAEQCLLEYEHQGYQLATITEFLQAIDQSGFEPPLAEPLLDGNWNMGRSRGCFTWLGWNRNESQNDLAVRTHNWKSRTQLLQLEGATKESSLEPTDKEELKKDIQDIWEHQLLAEVSDSTGWFPLQPEVWFGLQESETVLNQVAKLSGKLQPHTDSKNFSVDPYMQSMSNEIYRVNGVKEIPLSEAYVRNFTLVGAKGRIKLLAIDKYTQRLFVDFRPKDTVSGIQCYLDTEQLIYSPAILEDQVVAYDLSAFQPNQLYLPLVNGLIGIGNETYLIKHNITMHIACCIDKSNHMLRFVLENPKHDPRQWIMTIFRGSVEDAIQLALRINCI